MRWLAGVFTREWLKQYVIYLLVVAPFVIIDTRLIMPASHLAGYVVLSVIIFSGLVVKAPLQRRLWP